MRKFMVIWTVLWLPIWILMRHDAQNNSGMPYLAEHAQTTLWIWLTPIIACLVVCLRRHANQLIGLLRDSIEGRKP